MTNKKFISLFSVLAALTLFAIGCVPLEEPIIDDGGLPAGYGAVSGNVVVRNMIDYIELPEGAIVTVRLEDVSIADIPSTVLGEHVYEGVTQLPMDYEVRYELGVINESLSYAVSVRITDATDNLLFINDTKHPVLTRGTGNSTDVELIPIQ